MIFLQCLVTKAAKSLTEAAKGDMKYWEATESIASGESQQHVAIKSACYEVCLEGRHSH